METVNFSTAIEAVKEGKLIARSGWNGKGMFIFIRPEDQLSIEFITEKVKSLPLELKHWYLRQIDMGLLSKEDMVKFTAYLCMKAADGSIVNGWLASQTDILAEDWIIL